MARSLTNNFSLAYAIEASTGTLPGTPTWKLLEPEDISAFGATIATVARNPISQNRQRQKGTTTDLDSAVEFEHDLTMEVLEDFAEAFCFANAASSTLILKLQAGSDFDNLAAVATGNQYTHDAITAMSTQTLVYARGFSTSGNNGLSEVTGSPTTTVTPVTGLTLVDETPGNASGVTLETAGWRGSTSDLAITVSGTTATLVSSADISDWGTDLGLTAGQVIHVGGLTSSEQFSAGAGYARIASISGATLNLDKLDSGLATDPGTGEDVDILFGRFIRNVATSNADFLERTFQFQATYDNLQEPDGTGDEFEYAIGNFCNTMAWNLPLADKATITFGFIGTDTEDFVTTAKTNGGSPVGLNKTTAVNTTADIARLRITEADETGLTTCFKSLTLTLNNNVSPEKCLGTLGAVFVNSGNFEVDLETQLVFTDSDVVGAIRNNETVTMDFILTNDNGAVAVDIPSMTLGGGDREFPVNESILINLAGQAFQDATLGTSIGISLFPVVP